MSTMISERILATLDQIYLCSNGVGHPESHTVLPAEVLSLPAVAKRVSELERIDEERRLARSQWHGLGTASPDSDANPIADAGAHRIYYRHEQTGEYSYRGAGWGTHGTKVHGFRDFGDGTGCDASGKPNGKTYPADQY